MRLRAEGLSWREIDGETVVLDLVSSKYLTTNRTGTFLLRQLVVDRSMDELVTALAKEYSIEPATAARDTDAFLTRLRDRGLLVADRDAQPRLGSHTD
jgi:hypothetical protein